MVVAGTVVVVLVEVDVVADHPPVSAMVMDGGDAVVVVTFGFFFGGVVVDELPESDTGVVEEVLDADGVLDDVVSGMVDEVVDDEVDDDDVLDVDDVELVLVDEDDDVVDELEVVLLDEVDDELDVELDDDVVVDDVTALSSTAGSRAATLSVIDVGTFPRGPSISSN